MKTKKEKEASMVVWDDIVIQEVPFCGSMAEIEAQLAENLKVGKFSLTCGERFLTVPIHHVPRDMTAGPVFAFLTGRETGMEPFIMSTDFVVVNMGSRTIMEAEMYLIYIDGQLKIRYGEYVNTGFTDAPHYLMRGEQRKFRFDRLFFKDIKYHPIIGRVRSITHRFPEPTTTDPDPMSGLKGLTLETREKK